METFYVNKLVKQKFREEDQSFEVDDYNVSFYVNPYKGSDGNEYYLLQIHKFKGAFVDKTNELYVEKTEKETYPKMWEKLHIKSNLWTLVNMPRYLKICESEVVE